MYLDTLIIKDLLEKFKEKIRLWKLWKKIPGFGLILIIIKNLIGGAADVVVKKIVGIDPINLIFYRSLVMMSLSIPWSVAVDQPPFPSKMTKTDRALQILR